MPSLLLTDVFLKSAPEGEYWDAKVSGLVFRVWPRAKAWGFRYRPKGSAGRKRLALGDYPEVGLALARQRAEAARVAVSGGADPQGERQERKALASRALTFDALADAYIERYAKPNKKSWRQDALLLAAHVRPVWGAKKARDVTRGAAADLLDAIAARAPVSANRVHTILVKLFNWAVESDLAEANPLAGMKKRFKEKKSEERTLAPAEIRRLWEALDSSGVHPSVAAALRVLLLTGQRPGEIAGAERAELKDVENAAARLEIPAARMKAGAPHVIPLAPMAVGIVRESLARAPGHAFIFPSNFAARGPVARHSLSQALRRIIDGLDDAAAGAATLKANPPTPHDFRRSVATGLSALGVLRENRLAVLAHTPGDVHAQHYDRHDRLAEKRAALELWEAHLAKIIAPEGPSGAVVKLRRRAR